MQDESMQEKQPAKAEPNTYCSLLRSKKILMRSGLPRTDSDVLDGSNWVWCGDTELAIGPDGCSAGPEECQEGRACFRSPFEA